MESELGSIFALCFYEHLIERNAVAVSYTLTPVLLQEAGVVEKNPGRGTHWRRRERRPMVGMLVPLEASTHQRIAGLLDRARYVGSPVRNSALLFLPPMSAM